MIRWPNLVFIALTQSLFYFCILIPSFYQGNPVRENILKPDDFILLSLSSVLIAAAGYIINDYFDLHIDRINKPGKVVVEKIIKRRWAIIWHWIFPGLGILIGFYLSWKLRNIFIGPSNLVCVLLLWFYSTTFKKKLLIGNVLISLLTAWVIGVLYLCEFRLHRFVDPEFHGALSRVYKFTVVYASFAFIISLVREVIKDMEDMEGDVTVWLPDDAAGLGIECCQIFLCLLAYVTGGRSDFYPVLCFAIRMVDDHFIYLSPGDLSDSPGFKKIIRGPLNRPSFTSSVR